MLLSALLGSRLEVEFDSKLGDIDSADDSLFDVTSDGAMDETPLGSLLGPILGRTLGM